MKPTLGILGNDFILSTNIVDKIITNTKANNDQEHIKMNIVINNNLLNKSNIEIKDIINKLEKSKIDYLLLTFDSQDITNYIKSITTIPLIETLNFKEIIKTLGGEVK